MKKIHAEIPDLEDTPMVRPIVAKKLLKQGYRLVGSSSAVKLCHWAKTRLKEGPDATCYKHMFYGIQSHRCLQLTSCLACSSACSFCWRVRETPQVAQWDPSWNMDSPEFILDGSLKYQSQLIKELRVFPTAREEDIQAGMKPMHAALSLAGESLLYPAVNELVTLMHTRGISSFVVTNAQLPEQVRALPPVTQLYLSVDAPTEEILLATDHPIFDDAFHRMEECLRILATRPDRTAVRLTAVKGKNMCCVEEYARLIELGRPNFVEVKGMALTGQAQATMGWENTPTPKETADFAREVADALPDYELVGGHARSRAVLMARKEMLVDGQWNIWIDFPEFFRQFRSWENGQGFDKSKVCVPAPPAGALDAFLDEEGLKARGQARYDAKMAKRRQKEQEF